MNVVMNDSAFNFDTLSPDLIMAALEGVGLRVDSGLTALNSYENRVYQFTDEERRRYVVKFYRPERWNAAQIEEEHQFSLDLANAEVPAVAPLRLQGKRYRASVASILPFSPASADGSMR